ncbi:MAG: flagellar export chaperone FliS [Methylococcales bacterium]|nr:flagellar export chaperone FliS [Methylococcales bacterium]
MNASAAMKQYKTIGVHGGVMDASPHCLVQMMMEGVLEKIALAKGNVKRKEIANKGVNITKAINIVAGLRSSLDLQLGGEVAMNLDRLYDYMIHQLMKANAKSDEAMLDEVSGLMVDIKSSWDAIDGQEADYGA